MTKLRLSTSRVKTYLHCPKAYWWQYKEDVVLQKRSKALQVGDFTHIFLQKDAEGTLTKEYVNQLADEVQKAYPDNTIEESTDIAYDAFTYYLGHKEKFKDSAFKIESTEVHLECEMKGFTLYTRLDTLLRDQESRLWRGEYKTTARIDSAYLSGLKSGLQAGISYLVMQEVMPEPITGTIYDLIVKTKVPQYERAMILAERSLIQRTTDCLNGVADGILSERFYPSMECHYFNRECDFLPLCKHDSIATREAFYERRTEFYNKPKG
jgi:hypothetical protein